MVTKKNIKTKKISTKSNKKSVKTGVVKKKTSTAKSKKKLTEKKVITKKKIQRMVKKSTEKKDDSKSYFAKWTSLEHAISKDDSALYYISIVLALVTIVWYIMQGSLVVVITFFVLLIVILLQFFIAPHKIEYIISLDGILFDDVLYRYSDIKFFEVEIGEKSNILRIKLNTSFLPVKEINLVDQDPYYIRAVLENFLLEKKIEVTLFTFNKSKNEDEDEYFSDKDIEEFIEKSVKEKKL